jgi:hypothetical protein
MGAGGSMREAYENGLWVLILMEMTMRGLQNPDQESQFCCCPCMIKAKYMPWIFFVLISLFTFAPAFDFLAGIALGYAWNAGKLKWTVLSDASGIRIQDWFIFRWLQCFDNYIATEDS